MTVNIQIHSYTKVRSASFQKMKLVDLNLKTFALIGGATRPAGFMDSCVCISSVDSMDSVDTMDTSHTNLAYYGM